MGAEGLSKGAHDEGRTQHVGVHVAKAGSLGGRADPSVSCTPVKPAAVVAKQDRPSGTFSDPNLAGSPRNPRSRQARLKVFPLHLP